MSHSPKPPVHVIPGFPARGDRSKTAARKSAPAHGDGGGDGFDGDLAAAAAVAKLEDAVTAAIEKSHAGRLL